jgi:predicted Rossmann-fold nucleotide-binding protein
VPIILFGDDVKWDMELEFLKSHLVKTYGTIDAKDLDYIHRTSDMNKVKDILTKQKLLNE